MSISRVVAVVFAASYLAGCAAVTTVEGRRLALTSAEFRTYVERVFREQNRVATELGFALEDPTPGSAGAAALDAAEDRLEQACAGLNELATARRDDVALGVRHRAQSARTVPDCERATAAATAAVAAAKQGG